MAAPYSLRRKSGGGAEQTSLGTMLMQTSEPRPSLVVVAARESSRSVMMTLRRARRSAHQPFRVQKQDAGEARVSRQAAVC